MAWVGVADTPDVAGEVSWGLAVDKLYSVPEGQAKIAAGAKAKP
jgi:hypothetical protein